MDSVEGSQTNLIINYLPQHLTDEEFRKLFVTYGTVKTARIIRDKRTGYSYGFGFVDYDSPEEAERAIQALNGHEIQHKRIKVAYSRPQKGVNLYVKGLPKTMTQESLAELMKPYGEIVQCRILTDTYTGNPKGVGFVLFATQEEADNAIAACNGKVLPRSSEPLLVKVAEGKKAAAPSRNPYESGYGNQSGAAFYGSGDASYAQAAAPNIYGSNNRAGGPMRNPGNRMRYNPLNGQGGAASSGVYGTGSGPGLFGAAPSMYGSSPQTPPSGGHTLFVYNIGPSATDQTLWDLFSPFGTVSKVNVMFDHQKNQCKGFGFVTMLNYSEACYAINNLNGYNFCGKPLQVSLKKDKVDPFD